MRARARVCVYHIAANKGFLSLHGDKRTFYSVQRIDSEAGTYVPNSYGGVCNMVAPATRLHFYAAVGGQ